jgi:type I restriction enzyme R subunit
VDKNLKHHGLIQAFSRTNRVLNDSKPYGNVLDFRQQQKAVDEAIALFSGEKIDNPREIWLVEPAAEVLRKYEAAVAGMERFMEKKNLVCEPEQVYNLKGDTARIEFVNRFKEVQRLKTQLDQYTDLAPEQKAKMEAILPQEQLQSFRSTYLETAKRLKEQQAKEGEQAPPEVQQLDFEFVLFASALIDYDYIMGLIARMTAQKPGKTTMNREQLIGLIQADAKFIDEREDIAEYIRSLAVGQALDEKEIRAGYERFKAEKKARELNAIATKHRLDAAALQAFVDEVLRRRIFDGEALSELMAPLGLRWKARTQAELALMEDLTPLLHKLAQGREISGLSAYEQAR